MITEHIKDELPDDWDEFDIPQKKIWLMRNLYERYTACQRCGLCSPTGRDRINVVFGDGNVDAEVMIISDYPRLHDEAQGVPFYEDTAAGSVIDRFLASMQVTREDLWIDHMVMCRPSMEDDPSRNRPPNKEELAACRERLNEVIRIVDPRVIIILGKTALRLTKKWADVSDKDLAAHRDSISKTADVDNPPRLVVEVPGVMIPIRYEARATYHPSFLLRLKEAELTRDNGPYDRFFSLFKHAFRLVDAGNHIYFDKRAPVRGVFVE